jgi:hypothetical protein
MKATLYVSIIVIILGAALFWLVAFGPLKDFLPQSVQKTVGQIPDYFRGDRGGVPTTGGNTLPDSSQNNEPPASTWSVPTQNGGSIDVNQFMPAQTSSSSTQTPQPDSKPPSQDVFISGTREPLSDYLITYVAYDKSFNIGLFKEPLGETRKKAEQELLSKLGINEQQACNLRYAVVAPYWVNSFYGGKNLGFSFCPGATQL